jgi:hypothetical protein
LPGWPLWCAAGRRKIDTAIAGQQGTIPELAGQRRALEIAKKADPGTMIQNPDGKRAEN